MKRRVLSLVGCFGLLNARIPDEKIDFTLFASTNTYTGVSITVETIMALLPTTPENISLLIELFLSENPDVAAIMSGQEVFEGENPVLIQQKEEKYHYYIDTRKRLKTAGLSNLSKSSNTVVNVGNYIIKASSQLNREKNIGTGVFGLPWGSEITYDQLKEFNEKHGGKTYQGISRLAYLLRVREACELFGLDLLSVPQKYLVHIPGRPTELADTNYVVVEEKINYIVAELQNHPLAFDSEVIRQLVILIGYTGLWNHVGEAGNIVVVKNPRTGELRLYYHDTEQPNNHSPEDFFHKNKKIHFNNVRCGWDALKTQIIESYATKACASIDASNLPAEEKTFLINLVNERVDNLLKEKEILEKKIAAHFPVDCLKA